MKMKRRFRILVVLCMLQLSLFVSACSTVVREDLAADARLPESTETEVSSIIFDKNFPRYLVSVSPVQFVPRADTQIHTIADTSDPSQILVQENEQQTVVTQSEAGTKEVLAQLITALSNSGNISLIDFNALELDTRGRSSMPLAQHERGPYLVKARITEFGERVEEEQNGIDAKLGWVGAILSAAGSASDKPGLFWTGLGIALTNPMVKDVSTVKKGMLVMDVSVVDARSGRVLESFPASGTFISQEIEQGGGLNILHRERKESAKSTMSQAIRIACNEAMQKVTDVLKQKGRPKRLREVNGESL